MEGVDINAFIFFCCEKAFLRFQLFAVGENTNLSDCKTCGEVLLCC